MTIKGRIEKLSPQESPLGAYTVLTQRRSVMAPYGFSLGKPLAAKPWGLRPLGYAASGLSSENPWGAITLPLSTL